MTVKNIVQAKRTFIQQENSSGKPQPPVFLVPAVVSQIKPKDESYKANMSKELLNEI